MSFGFFAVANLMLLLFLCFSDVFVFDLFNGNCGEHHHPIFTMGTWQLCIDSMFHT